MKWLAATIIIAAAAQAAQTNWPSVLTQAGKPEKARAVTFEKYKVKAEKKDKDGKKEAREFPLMFDIAQRAKHKKASKPKPDPKTKGQP